MAKLSFIHIFLAFILALCQAQTPPTIVYRADLLPPDELKLQKKFFPRGMGGTREIEPPLNTSLYNHVQGAVTGTSRYDSGFVSTTTDMNFARQFVQTTLGGSGYIYAIHVTPNFIDAAGTLGQFYTHSEEREYAALGPIYYEQVLGWTEVIGGVEQPLVGNRDYDITRFGQYTDGGIQPQLAGFPPNHRAWGLEPWRPFANCHQADSRKRSPHEECIPKESSPDFASDYVGKTTVTGVNVYAALGDGVTAGTTDTILIGIGNYPTLVKLFEDPSRGDYVSVDINMAEIFGGPETTLHDLSQLVLFQQPTDHPIASDDFTLESMISSPI